METFLQLIFICIELFLCVCVKTLVGFVFEEKQNEKKKKINDQKKQQHWPTHKTDRILPVCRQIYSGGNISKTNQTRPDQI